MKLNVSYVSDGTDVESHGNVTYFTLHIKVPYVLNITLNYTNHLTTLSLGYDYHCL